MALLVVVDGWRRVPPDSTVLRRAPFGAWRPVSAPARGGRHRLLSWGAPFAVTVCLPPATAADPRRAAPVAPLGARLMALRVLGGITAISLIGGVPTAARWFGGVGFVGAIGAVVVLSAGTALAAAALGRAVTPAGGRRIAWVLPLASPFGTARAGDVFLERALAGAAPVLVARVLLHPQDFAAWVRPLVFDRLRVPSAHDTALDGVLDADGMRALVESRPLPRDGAASFCPRCGMGFTASRATCAECAVDLEPY